MFFFGGGGWVGAGEIDLKGGGGGMKNLYDLRSQIQSNSQKKKKQPKCLQVGLKVFCIAYCLGINTASLAIPFPE